MVSMVGRPISLAAVRHHRAEILSVASRWGAHDLRVFGSVACEAANLDSDLDLIARFDPSSSLLDLGALKAELEALLGCPVDLLSEAGLATEFRREALARAVPL